MDLRTDYRDERVGLYLRLFEAAGSETGFTAAALRRLAPVARVLALAPADVHDVHARAFGSAVDDALADDCLTVEERPHLVALQQSLGLDEAAAAQAVEAKAQTRLLHAVARALCDSRLDGASRRLVLDLGADAGAFCSLFARARAALPDSPLASGHRAGA